LTPDAAQTVFVSWQTVALRPLAFAWKGLTNEECQRIGANRRFIGRSSLDGECGRNVCHYYFIRFIEFLQAAGISPDRTTESSSDFCPIAQG
jgi:hypothetical protein